MSAINNAKVLDLTKRIMKLTTRSNMSIAEVASAHYTCLAGLAMEASSGDKVAAAKLIRECVEDLAVKIEDPSLDWRVGVQEGKTVPPSNTAAQPKEQQ